MSTQTIRVLLAEGTPEDARLVHELLRRVPLAEPVHVQTLSEALACLEAQAIDVVLLNPQLAEAEGPQAIEALQAAGHMVQVVVLAGHEDDQAALAWIRAGALDHLLISQLSAGALHRRIHLAAQRTRIARSLAQSATRYRILFEDASDAILIADVQTETILDANKAAERLLGRSRQELIGIDRAALHPPQGVFSSEFSRHIAAGRTRDAETVLLARDGRQIPVTVSASSFQMGDRRVIQGVFRDLSGLRRAQEELESLSRFPAENPSPVMRASVDGTLLYANASSAPLLRHWACHPGARLPEEQALLVAQAIERDQVLQVELLLPDRVYEMTVCPLVSEGRANLYGHDITARKHAEAARFESEANLQMALEATHTGAWTLNVADRSILRTLEYDRILGHDSPPSRWTYQDFLQQILPEDRPQVAQGFEKTLMTGSKWDFSCRIQRPDGEVRWLRGLASPRQTGSGPQVVSGLLQDVTEKKRSEEEKTRLEEQLRASQRMEAVGGLAGGIAHDFNNLLSVILSYTSFALESAPEGSPLHEDLLEVRKAGERAAALVRQLLAFSRKQMLQPKVLSLNLILAEFRKMLLRILGEDIEFVHEFAPELGLTLADPNQIEQVIMNLVVNARDAMPEGGTLTMKTANASLEEEQAARLGVAPGPYVTLTVQDTGLGMDEETLARVFEPFFTTKEKGTGLGLPTVYGIVRQSGGAVEIQSLPGQGTSFRVWLPRLLSAILERPPGAEAHALPEGAETILVVEDERAVRNLARRVLSAAGYSVLLAESAQDARTVLQGHSGRLDLVLTDVVMPGMKGTDFARDLARTHQGLKVLFMSGYSAPSASNTGLPEWRGRFISKPFAAEDLVRKVREVLDQP